jgi:hypothetical protein|nr:MAG TPA: hypothetical protein [Bacteriophage sp.]
MSLALFYLIQIRMDKEKILSGLKAKIESSGEKITLSDRTISDYAAGIASLVSDETQLTEDFFNAHMGIIKSMNGNFSHDVAAQVEETKKNLANPQTSPATSPATPPSDEKPQWAKDLEKQIQTLSETQQNAQKQAQRNQLIESVRNRATKKDASDDKTGWAVNAGVLNNAIAVIQIEDDDTMETVEKKRQDKYNSMCVEIFGSLNAVPGAGGEKEDTGTDWIAAEKKRQQEAGRLPKD